MDGDQHISGKPMRPERRDDHDVRIDGRRNDFCLDARDEHIASCLVVARCAGVQQPDGSLHAAEHQLNMERVMREVVLNVFRGFFFVNLQSVHRYLENEVDKQLP
jgi:hypothetical protein